MSMIEERGAHRQLTFGADRSVAQEGGVCVQHRFNWLQKYAGHSERYLRGESLDYLGVKIGEYRDPSCDA